jgi:phage gpG-like protein
MSLKVTITGLEKLKAAGNMAIAQKEKLKARIREEVVWFGEKAVGTSRQKYLSGRPGLNVVTGRLRSSINYRVTNRDHGFQLDVGTNVPYAAVHEFGDRRGFIRPRPFLQPAVEDEYGNFTDEIERVLENFAGSGLGQ